MEDKKVYSVIGTVTIGTDEYRDLLSDKFEAEKKVVEENDRWYKEYRRANDLEKQVNALTEKMKKCEKFIRERYKSCEKGEQEEVDNKSIDNSSDIIALFMSIFGEE